MYIKNCRNNSKFKHFSPFELCRKLENKCFAIGNFSYTHRYLQGEERETIEHKLKILKRELKHIIEKLTDWKDFVFADPHNKKTCAHYTHLQIA